MQVMNFGAVRTMTSREIAELTGKRHDHVMTDIRKMLSELGVSSPDFSGEYKDSTGRTLPCFNLPKEPHVFRRGRMSKVHYQRCQTK